MPRLRRIALSVALVGLVAISGHAFRWQDSGRPAKSKAKVAQSKTKTPTDNVLTAPTQKRGDAKSAALLPPKPELVIQNNHADNIRTLAFSPDGGLLASGGADKTVRLWDARNGRLIRIIRDIYDDVTSLVFSPNGKLLASGGLDRNVSVWMVETGKLIHSFKDHDDDVNALAFSSDGKLIASGSKDQTINLYNAHNGELLLTLEPQAGNVRAVAFSPDAKTIAACADKTIRLWDVASGDLIRSFVGHTAEVRALAFSPDGRLLISGSADRSVKVWEAATATLLRTLTGHTGGVLSVAASADGRLIASGSEDRTLKLWEANTGNLTRTIEWLAYPIAALAFRPDGRMLATASWKTIGLWSVSDGSLIETFESLSSEVRAVAIRPDGRQMATASSRIIQLWDTESGRLLKKIAGHSAEITGVAFSPDGKRLISGSWDRTVKLWDAESGALLQTFTGHDAQVRSVAFSPDGQTLASGGEDRTIRLWNVRRSRALRTLEKHYSLISALAFSPDGKRLASASVDRTVKIWETATGNLLHSLDGHFGQVTTVAFSPDGKTIASGSGDKTVRLWDAQSGQPIRTIEASTFDILAVAFSPDGKLLASAGFDKTIKLWTVADGKALRTFAGHESPVSALAFHPHQPTLASGSWDTSVRLWGIDTGRLLTTMIAFDGGDWIAFTPSGQYEGSEKSASFVGWRLGTRVYDFDQLFSRFYEPEVVSKTLHDESLKPPQNIEQGFATPPEVEIVSPQMNQVFRDTEVEVKIAARDTGGGITDVWLYHNGKLVDPSQRGLKTAKNAKLPAATYKVLLTEGDNYFRAVAFSKDRTESRPDEVLVRLAAPGRETTLHLLVVGINRYKNPALDLNFAEPDAAAIGDYFEKQGNRLFREVKVTRLFNEEASRANLLKSLAELIARAEPQDAVILYFAGHGDSAGDKWYFVPYEVTNPENEEVLITQALSSDALSEFVVKMRSLKILLLLDACKSGRAVTAFRSFEDRKALAQLARSTGIHIIAASTPDQSAAEVKDLGHGVFTYLLLKGLQGEATVGEAGKSVTVRGLLAYLEDQMPEVSKKYRAQAQYPVSNSKGMDFPLSLVPSK